MEGVWWEWVVGFGLDVGFGVGSWNGVLGEWFGGREVLFWFFVGVVVLLLGWLWGGGVVVEWISWVIFLGGEVVVGVGFLSFWLL